MRRDCRPETPCRQVIGLPDNLVGCRTRWQVGAGAGEGIGGGSPASQVLLRVVLKGSEGARHERVRASGTGKPQATLAHSAALADVRDSVQATVRSTGGVCPAQ